MTKHSDKALTTLARMGTTPEAWSLTEIEWVEEEREVPGPVRCPECDGGKWVVYVDGVATPVPPNSDHNGRHEYQIKARKSADMWGKGLYGNCKRCKATRGNWRGVPTGKVTGLVTRKVMVGYPKFPAGTKFESRFTGGMSCQLCNKTILKSGRVPVNTTGEKPLGMWVGEDCARKFLSVKVKRAADSVMEDPR